MAVSTVLAIGSRIQNKLKARSQLRLISTGGASSTGRAIAHKEFTGLLQHNESPTPNRAGVSENSLKNWDFVYWPPLLGGLFSGGASGAGLFSCFSMYGGMTP